MDDGSFCGVLIFAASGVWSEEFELGLSFKDDGLLQSESFKSEYCAFFSVPMRLSSFAIAVLSTLSKFDSSPSGTCVVSDPVAVVSLSAKAALKTEAHAGISLIGVFSESLVIVIIRSFSILAWL
jgi:hypothetical protein